MEFSSDFFEFPLPDEVKDSIESILREEKPSRELIKTAILQSLKKRGGEIRLNEKQFSGFENLGEIVDISSGYVRQYEHHPLLEGAILISLAQRVCECVDIGIFFILSDLALPPIMREWRKGGMGDTPIGGVWHEWYIFNDKDLPADELKKFKGRVISTAFMTPQMIRNEIAEAKKHPTFPLSMLQYGVVIYDKRGVVKELFNSLLPMQEDYFSHWKKIWYEKFMNLLLRFENLLTKEDIIMAEFVSVQALAGFLYLMFSVESKIEPHEHPGFKRILVFSRKLLPSEIVEKVEKALLCHDLLERLKILQALDSYLSGKDEFFKNYRKKLMNKKEYENKADVELVVDDFLDWDEDKFRRKRMEEYYYLEDFLWILRVFVEKGDRASAKIVSVECVDTLVSLVSIMEKKNFKIHELKRIENVLVIHDVSKRLKLLNSLRSDLTEKDEQMKECHEAYMKYWEEKLQHI